MEHCLSFLIVIFKVFLLFFLCRNPGGKLIAPYLLSKQFRPYFRSASKVCVLVDWVFIVLIICSVLFWRCWLERFQRFVVKRLVRKKFTYHHHHHIVPPARISLTLSRHFSLLFIASGRSSGLHPVSSRSCSMYFRAFLAQVKIFSIIFGCIPGRGIEG